MSLLSWVICSTKGSRGDDSPSYHERARDIRVPVSLAMWAEGFENQTSSVFCAKYRNKSRRCFVSSLNVSPALFVWVVWGLGSLLGAANACGADVLSQRWLLMCSLTCWGAWLTSSYGYCIVTAPWQAIAFFFSLDLKLLVCVYWTEISTV